MDLQWESIGPPYDAQGASTEVQPPAEVRGRTFDGLTRGNGAVDDERMDSGDGNEMN